MKDVRQLGCVFQDTEPLESLSILRKSTTILEPIRRVRFTKATQRHANIRDKEGPSLGKIQVKNPHQRRPHTMKFEEQSHEETESQQRCGRSKAWSLAKNIYEPKEKVKATFYAPAEEWVLPAASTKKSEERKFVVDSGASMHMVSKKDLNSAELDTMTADGEVQTREEATECVK